MTVASCHKIVRYGPFFDRYKGKSDMAGIDTIFNFHYALAYLQSIQEYFFSPVQKEGVLAGENVLFVLQPEIDLRVAVAQDVNWQH